MIDMYGEDVARASELIRKHAGTEYYHYFAINMEASMEAFIAMMDSCREEGRIKGRGEALAELHPQWLAEKERADKAEARIAELEAQVAELREMVPTELHRIGELLRTQDNLITDQPIFIVQQKHSYVTDEDYNDARIEWCHVDGYERASPLREKRLEAIYHRTGNDTLHCYRRFAVHDVWEFVTACFTEQGCKDYLAKNNHNLKEPRIYADGSYRNEEYRAVRNWLMSLPAAPSTVGGINPPQSMADIEREMFGDGEAVTGETNG